MDRSEHLTKVLTTKGVEATRICPGDGIDRENLERRIDLREESDHETGKNFSLRWRKGAAYIYSLNASPMTQCMTEEVRLGVQIINVAKSDALSARWTIKSSNGTSIRTSADLPLGSVMGRGEPWFLSLAWVRLQTKKARTRTSGNRESAWA